MSKMSQLHAELTEQANELGFESIEEAERNGYAVNYEKGILEDGREQAHLAYIVEREEHLNEMKKVVDILIAVGQPEMAACIESAREFFKKGEV